MTAPVTFVYNDWAEQYPEFKNLPEPMAMGYFMRASFLCGNEGCNPLNGVTGMLSAALYLLTSHIAWLNAPRDANGNPTGGGGTPASPIVGRINTASEGSVSVGADMGDATAGSPSQPWYMQTRYGAEYWAMTAGVRTARYVAQPTIVPGPVYPWLGPGVY